MNTETVIVNTPTKSPSSFEQQVGRADRGQWTSASSAPADALCAGRHQAQAGRPDEPSEDAEFGRQIHEALATDDSSKLSPEQLNIYDSFVEIREKLITDVFGVDAQNVKRIKEKRHWVKVRSADGQTFYPHSGQSDLICRSGSKGLIVEYKSLPGDLPEAPENLQLRDQVVLTAGNLKLDDIEVAIIQPLVTHTPARCHYNKEAIARSEAEMFARVLASNTPGAARTAGEAQCKFCKARHDCATRAKFLEVSTPMAVSALASVPVAQWTPSQRSLFCERMPVAAKWLEDCKKQLKDGLALDPEFVPGWTLDDGSIKRPVVKPEELHARFLALGGTTEQFLSAVEIGKGKLEAVVRTVTGLKGKKLAAKIDELLDGLTVEKKDAPSLGRKEAA